VVIPPPTIVSFEDLLTGNAAFLDGLAGVYAIQLRGGEPHFAWTKNLGKRLIRLCRILRSQAESNPGIQPDQIQCWPTSSELERLLLLYTLSKNAFPSDYNRRLRLHRAWFLSLVDEAAWARLAVSQRVRSSGSAQLGPFPNRESAETLAEALLGLFQIRRCTESLQPDPQHPGCIYGEIGQCSRPCQAQADPLAYREEAKTIEDILNNGPQRLIDGLQERRTQASDELDFERAADIHKRIDRAERVRELRNKGLQPIELFSGLALTRTFNPGHVRVWPMLRSLWQPSVDVDVSQRQDVESAFEQLSCLHPNVDGRTSPFRDEHSDHLAVFLRWHRSSFHKELWLARSSTEGLRKATFTRSLKKVLSQTSKTD
jgi:excinuclease ABC subunit C